MNDRDSFFAHLHVRSDYTLSRGASKVKGLVAEAAKLGLPAMALTDEGNMYGAMEFSKVAAASGVQPVVGVELKIQLGEDAKGSLVLLAQDAAGYASICAVLAASHRPDPETGYRGAEGVVDPATLSGLEGVIMLTGGRDGFLAAILRTGDAGLVDETMNWLRYEFCDRLYVEIDRYGDEGPDEVEVEEMMLDYAYAAPPLTCRDGVERSGVPVVATSPAWYASVDRHDAFEILKAVEGKKKLAVEDGRIVPSGARRFHLRSADEMRSMFSDLPEAFLNASAIARRCAFKVEGRSPLLPSFATAEGRTEAEEMRVQAREGLERRLDKAGKEEGERAAYRERLDYELGIIEKMEFPGYFLIVADFIVWAKERGIPVGPGRGSGAGSVVAWSLGITDLDPLAFGLLFERFLNPDRVSMPDFDIDFCQDRRDEVIRYVREKYGEEHVSMIATFGEIKSKTAIKDVGRVMLSDEFGGFGFGELDRLTKVIPMNGPEPVKLAEAMSHPEDTAFRTQVQSEAKYGVLVRAAMQIEGLYRTQGLHAAGVIIAGASLDQLVPVGWDVTTSIPVCQFNMKAAEDAGLVKFDFLGLKTLSVIRETLEHVRMTTGETIDLETLPLDDQETYAMLAEGFTNGVFQFESEGMKKWMRALKPNRFEDLIALGALYRPGPMEMIPTYVSCKNGTSVPDYPEPVDRTKPFLEETFGIMVYQEQVMQVAQVVAGFSLGGADLLRRAMGKKIPAEMEKQRILFVEGATAKGTPAKTAGALFDLIAKFAGYGFNKSHAAAYALVAYHTAYLKRHYPAEFMSALLTYETSDPKKMSKVKDDMDHFGIPMLPPDVNRSWPRFRPEKVDGGWGVRLGLSAIKGISGDLAVLMEARKDGPFTDLVDFHNRAGTQWNKGQTEKLVEAGAFDCLHSNRYAALNVLSFLSKGNKKAAAGQEDLFGGSLGAAVPAEKYEVQEWGNRIDREFGAVGFYFGQHPLDAYASKFDKLQVKRRASLVTFMTENGRAELKGKRMAGLVEFVDRRVSAKTNRPFLTVKLAEKQDVVDAMIFNDEIEEIERLRKLLDNAKAGRRPVILVADLVLKPESGQVSIWGRKVYDADEVLAAERGKLRLLLDPAAVLLVAEEQKEYAAAEKGLASGALSAETAGAAKASVRSRALARKVSVVKEALERMRDDSSSQGTEIMLSVKMEDGRVANVEMPGRYVVNQASENVLKSIDGIVSVTEEV